MKFRKLGSSGIDVSQVCLGSMTWGVQNNQQDANEQIEYALEHEVNFIDTAEMYAVPPSPETYGKTETIIGNWLDKNRDKRQDIVLASKIAGPTMPWVREGGPVTGEAIISSVDASLKRLQTDYIDLYQIHWPNRPSAHFNQHWPNQVTFSDADPKSQSDQILDILEGVQACIKAGKIRFAGLSNETPWGLNQYLKLSEKHDLPRMVSMQNEFSLIHAKDWPHLMENCIHEDIAYLPWSPIAGGMLSGKYLNGARPEGSRWTISQRNGIFRDTEMGHKAVQAYQDIAQSHGLTTAQLALAWCDQIDGVTSTIIGATTIEQLDEDIKAFRIELSESTLQEITSVFRQYPAPF